ncbi:hypothetical protein [Flavobacterium sp.]|uniref:hypothetical protein n=1 Tax=Flavobacterium sp. TaxID=239 RepID=UPI00261FDAA1|nr:hypothetical protein [Flavobacterium sp.]
MIYLITRKANSPDLVANKAETTCKLYLYSVTVRAQGRKKIEFAASHSAPNNLDKMINEGNASENGKSLRSLEIVYDGDIEIFVNKLELDLGNVNPVIDGKLNKTIYFQRFKKPEWSENKLTLKLQSISNGNHHMISIVCTDNKKNDLLEYGSETQKKIIDYLENKLVSKK